MHQVRRTISSVSRGGYVLVHEGEDPFRRPRPIGPECATRRTLPWAMERMRNEAPRGSGVAGVGGGGGSRGGSPRHHG